MQVKKNPRRLTAARQDQALGFALTSDPLYPYYACTRDRCLLELRHQPGRNSFATNQLFKTQRMMPCGTHNRHAQSFPTGVPQSASNPGRGAAGLHSFQLLKVLSPDDIQAKSVNKYNENRSVPRRATERTLSLIKNTRTHARIMQLCRL